jgi:hypothetical protein
MLIYENLPIFPVYMKLKYAVDFTVRKLDDVAETVEGSTHGRKALIAGAVSGATGIGSFLVLKRPVNVVDLFVSVPLVYASIAGSLFTLGQGVNSVRSRIGRKKKEEKE